MQTRYIKGRWLGHKVKVMLLGLILVFWGSSASTQQVLNPQIQVGIVQRFGQNMTDKLTLESVSDAPLELRFQTQGQWQTLKAQKVQFEIMAQPLSPPRVEERVVLSTHRSFESAETMANRFRAMGIAVEIAQPQQWEVWAKRQNFQDVEQRALLISHLRSQGHNTAYVAQRTLQQQPQLSWVLGNYRFNRNQVQIRAPQGQLRVNQDLYAGNFQFQPNAYGTYTLVNQVPIETYLRGVVPHEIGYNAPETAIQAQAIIARTYALRNLRRFEIDNYQLCADTQCQVYKGLNGTDPIVDRAIAATAGQVLTYRNELVDTLYSSTTGGVTAAFEDVWEGESRPYLKSVIDAVPNQVWDLANRPLSDETNFRQFINLRQGFNEETWRHFRWQNEASLTELNQNFRQLLEREKNPLASFQTIERLNVVERAPGGRVQRLRVTTDLGAKDLTKDEILRAFAAPNSLLFYIEPRFEANAQVSDRSKLKGYSFVGGGLGHGVGLSQTGSYRLSNIGWSAAQILNFYYSGTTLQPLTSSVVYWREPTASSPEPQVLFQPQPAQRTPGTTLFGLRLPWNLREWFSWLPFGKSKPQSALWLSEPFAPL
ncbi:SpoIID/LytB domain-containing protein [Synechococcales cyanobacterium C]|uniref:SpoIID/LytB domain-containing protein n=1 Tax=Petrachloros mirabilis ULC683 TaxID=2781853 RepID=A0A8K2A1Y0_9CYAN|nr:SpoIID/LytB domain-containing protein [Petrachloros mirabilis]NCJ08213.1 SpoIID/LytB domain-containing protein [Petrachloros mirabilis ULC683]